MPGAQISKGVSLPVNAVIIIILAVLVFAALGLFFSGNYTQGTNTIAVEKAYSDGCNVLFYTYSCNKEPKDVTIKGFNPDNDPGKANTGDSLARACELKFSWQKDSAKSTPKSDECKKNCGCITTTTT